MSGDANKVSLELAHRDLEDIHALRESQAFHRYWMRRLDARAAKLEHQFRYGPADTCGYAEREILRRIVLEYEQLTSMLDEDERAALATISRLNPQERV